MNSIQRELKLDRHGRDAHARRLMSLGTSDISKSKNTGRQRADSHNLRARDGSITYIYIPLYSNHELTHLNFRQRYCSRTNCGATEKQLSELSGGRSCP